MTPMFSVLVQNAVQSGVQNSVANNKVDFHAKKPHCSPGQICNVNTKTRQPGNRQRMSGGAAGRAPKPPSAAAEVRDVRVAGRPLRRARAATRWRTRAHLCRGCAPPAQSGHAQVSGPRPSRVARRPGRPLRRARAARPAFGAGTRSHAMAHTRAPVPGLCASGTERARAGG